MIMAGSALLDDYCNQSPVDALRTMVGRTLGAIRYDEILRDVLDQRDQLGSRWKLKSLQATLAQTANFEDGWDGYEASRPGADAIRQGGDALTVAWSANALPSAVVPSNEGGIALCWDDDSRHAYIEFVNDGTAIAAMYRGMEEPLISEFKPTRSQVLTVVDQIRQFMRT